MEKTFNKGSKNSKKKPKSQKRRIIRLSLLLLSSLQWRDIPKEYLETGSYRYYNTDITAYKLAPVTSFQIFIIKSWSHVSFITLCFSTIFVEINY